MSFEVAELQRQFFNLVKIGTVEEVDYNKSTAKVRFGNVVTDYLPWLTTRAGWNRTYNSLDEGEQVLVLTPPGGAIGVIIGAIYCDTHPAPKDRGAHIQKTIYEDGSTITYDRKASVLTADIKGDVVVKTTKSITATAGTTISAIAEEDISATSTGGNISVDASGAVSIKAGSNVNIEAPTIELNGTTFINGTMTQNGGTGGSASFKGSLNTDGDITTKADVIANVSLNSHKHKCPDGVTEVPI